jgi:hypothetical protein
LHSSLTRQHCKLSFTTCNIGVSNITFKMFCFLPRPQGCDSEESKAPSKSLQTGGCKDYSHYLQVGNKRPCGAQRYILLHRQWATDKPGNRWMVPRKSNQISAVARLLCHQAFRSLAIWRRKSCLLPQEGMRTRWAHLFPALCSIASCPYQSGWENLHHGHWQTL